MPSVPVLTAAIPLDIVEGYRDGLDLNNPEPGPNRSACYRFGFANARDDRRGRPRFRSPQEAEELYEAAIKEDRDNGIEPYPAR